MKECRHSNMWLLYIEPRTGWQQSFNIWSVTVGPVRPDIYPYSFNVDGVTVMDPANEDFFPNERFKAIARESAEAIKRASAFEEGMIKNVIPYVDKYLLVRTLYGDGRISEEFLQLVA